MTYMSLAVDHGPMSSLADLLDTSPFLQAGMHVLIQIHAEVMCLRVSCSMARIRNVSDLDSVYPIMLGIAGDIWVEMTIT
jgi:hypothetical protein